MSAFPNVQNAALQGQADAGDPPGVPDRMDLPRPADLRAHDENWYCVHTRPLKESQASTYCLRNLGLEIYFPRLVMYRTIRRVRKLVTKPLFPRYFFCRFDRFQYFRAVRYSPDVLDVVRKAEVPVIVPDDLIDELKRWASDAVDILTLQPELQAGDPVEIVDGPMRGLTAVILRIANDRDRVAVLLTALQCASQITISRSQLRQLQHSTG